MIAAATVAGILICCAAILVLGKFSLLPTSLTRYAANVEDIGSKPDHYLGLKRATAGLRAAIAIGATQSQFSEKVQDVAKELILAKQQASVSAKDDIQLSLYANLLDDCQKVLQTWERRSRLAGYDNNYATAKRSEYDHELQTEIHEVLAGITVIETAGTVK